MMIAEKVPPFILQGYSGLNNPWVAGFMEGTTRDVPQMASPHTCRVHRDVLVTMASLRLIGERMRLRE